MKKILLTLSLTLLVAVAFARRSDNIKLRAPLDIPLELSGNFGELRKGHFHSGIDIKTQGQTGFPVYAVDDGYVSRALVSPWALGRAVYIVHPETGLTTVYGHLESFAPKIDSLMRERQYAEESFSVDIEFEPKQIPVKRGDLIAYSGNAGSSGGPHLHFDVRDTETGNALDPLEYYREAIKDNTPPEVRQLALYPWNGGTVEGSRSEATYRQPREDVSFTAWGEVVPGIKAYDLMTGTTNIYGVKYLTLLQDGDTVYRRVIDEFVFKTSRALNTVINTADLIDNSSWIMITRVPPTNPLDYMIKAKNNGIVRIDEERPYKFVWILEDEHGNKKEQPFTVNGKRRLPHLPMAKGQLALWDADNVIQQGPAYVEIPKGALYENAFVQITDTVVPGFVSKLVSVGSPAVPLAQPFDLSLRIDSDTLKNKKQYCLVRVNGSDRSAVESTFADGIVSAKLSGFGKYAVTTDTTPPEITPIDKSTWKSNKTVSFKISDNLSGIESWRAELDGKWALFEFDGKTGTLWFKIDEKRFPGADHTLKLVVTDACGNTSTFTEKI